MVTWDCMSRHRTCIFNWKWSQNSSNFIWSCYIAIWQHSLFLLRFVDWGNIHKPAQWILKTFRLWSVIMMQCTISKSALVRLLLYQLVSIGSWTFFLDHLLWSQKLMLGNLQSRAQPKRNGGAFLPQGEQQLKSSKHFCFSLESKKNIWSRFQWGMPTAWSKVGRNRLTQFDDRKCCLESFPIASHFFKPLQSSVEATVGSIQSRTWIRKVSNCFESTKSHAIGYFKKKMLKLQLT